MRLHRLDEALGAIQPHLGSHVIDAVKELFTPPWNPPQGVEAGDLGVVLFDWRQLDPALKQNLTKDVLFVFQVTPHLEAKPGGLQWISQTLVPFAAILLLEEGLPVGVLFLDLAGDTGPVPVAKYMTGTAAKDITPFADSPAEAIEKLRIRA